MAYYYYVNTAGYSCAAWPVQEIQAQKTKCIVNLEDRNQIKDRIDKETARRLKLRLEEIEEQIRQQVTDELKEQQTRDEKEKKDRR